MDSQTRNNESSRKTPRHASPRDIAKHYSEETPSASSASSVAAKRGNHAVSQMPTSQKPRKRQAHHAKSERLGSLGSRPQRTARANAEGATVADRVMGELSESRKRTFLLVAAIAIVALIIVSVVSFCAMRQEATSTFEGNTYCYISGQKTEIEGPATAEEQDGVWVLKGQGDMTLTLGGFPLYQEGKNDVFFGGSTMVVMPDKHKVLSVDERTTVTAEANGATLTSHLNKQVPISCGFIYDGLDTYTLLGSATLETEAGEIELSPLTSIESIYGDPTWVYDPQVGEVNAFETQDVRVNVGTTGFSYSIDVANDTLYIDDTPQLLLGSGAVLDSIFG